ncbi:hypothetical protein SAMN05216266_1472 [Amycolatopsis marina]|uniref:HTH cro/C1-type domain-containing protein n=1 Tax=Amycolatopsis marina TaxID=490629 RepID=A0A1I1CRL3_9PSEU|nr:helix-turn-helix transcriptional regulator [Amycolatopsis marina]SFB64742.1 hypothetical protein SAMN05216266_1472 [Amycolatopsis marina]
MAGPDPTRSPNLALTALRESRALSQQGLAEDLNRLAITRHRKNLTLSKKSVYRWESGETVSPTRFYQQLLAEYFDVEISQLGFLRPHHVRTTPDEAPGFDLNTATTDVAPEVVRDQQRWLATRTALGASRRRLAVIAEGLYPDHRLPDLKNTGVIAHPAGIPEKPLPLTDVSLILDSAAALPAVTGGEPQSATVRPLVTPGQRHRRYHDAIRELAAPRLFENRLCFRLTDLDLSSSTLWMNFGHMGFFDSLDTNEALAHETAHHHLARDHQDRLTTTKPSWRGLTFRKLIGNPFDLTRRPLMGAVGTLTLRGGDSPSVVLHQRDGERVAGGGGMTHLLPAGIFQPSSVIPAGITEDFSLWRNIQREFAEELLVLQRQLVVVW